MKRAAWSILLSTACGSPGVAPGAAPPPAAAPITIAAPETPEAPEQPRDRLRDAIRAAEKRAAELRGLKVDKPLDIEFVSREGYKQFVLRQLDEPSSAHESEALMALQALPVDFDAKAIWGTLAESPENLGAYDARERKMVVVEDAPAQDCMLLHEVVHGLQAQHFDLAKLLYDPKRSQDARNAISMLAEADASSVPCEVAPEDVPQAIPRPSARPAPSIPEIVNFELSDQRIGGDGFVRYVLANGDYRKLDEAWRAPPSSTKQLFHPDAYERKELPLTVPTPVAPEARGWTIDYEETWGELRLGSLLATWEGGSRPEAAQGWGGDRVAVFGKPPHRIALAWRIRFDQRDGKHTEADEARQAMIDALSRTAPMKQVASFNCSERPDFGPIAVGQSGSDVLVLAGPYDRDANRRTSASKCAASARWGAKIFAQKP